MIQPGMMFGGEGPVMNGTWYNPHTGDAFTVRDSFFEDNQYVVTTTDGRYFRYDQLQNYIQSDMKLEDLKKMKVENKPVEKLPAEVSNLIDDSDSSNPTYTSMLLPEDEELIRPRSLGNLGNTPTVANYTPRNEVKTTPVNMNSAIIEKALKNSSMPNFDINVKWDDYPSKQIEMLKDIMEISPEEIVEWYLGNIKLDDFILSFKNAINDKIMFDNNIENTETIKLPEPEETIVIEVPEVIDTYNITDDGALAKELKKIGEPKSPRGGRKPVNKKK